LGVKELEHAYRAKMLICEKHPEHISKVDTLKLKVAEIYKRQALEKASELISNNQFGEARQYAVFATEIHGDAIACHSHEKCVDWFLELIHQMWRIEPQTDLSEKYLSSGAEKSQQPPNRQPTYRQVVDGLRPRNIAEEIPTKKLVKAFFYKTATLPGLKWLRSFENLGKKLMG
jgi:hypothetical protein